MRFYIWLTSKLYENHVTIESWSSQMMFCASPSITWVAHKWLCSFAAFCSNSVCALTVSLCDFFIFTIPVVKNVILIFVIRYLMRYMILSYKVSDRVFETRHRPLQNRLLTIMWLDSTNEYAQHTRQSNCSLCVPAHRAVPSQHSQLPVCTCEAEHCIGGLDRQRSQRGIE